MPISKRPLICKQYDAYSNCEEKNLCDNYETTGRIEPSENDVLALIHKYGADGFSAPNRDLFIEGGLRPVYIVN